MTRPLRRIHSEAASRVAFDVWNEVPLVPQLTGMSCWAAAAAMLVGWRDRISVRPDEVASGAGHWGAYEDGLHPRDVETLARTFQLRLEPARRWDVLTLRRRLEAVGPLWLGEASPGLHSIVITGIFGDGTPDGTLVRINDPWPIGRGERYLLTFRELMQNLDAASALVGGSGQVLHSGGRGASSSSYEWQEERFETYGQVAATPGLRYLLSSSLPHDPLTGHGGSGENLFLCWNAIPADVRTLDVVVHLHGYSPNAPTRALLEDRVRIAGLDLSRRAQPTLGIVPRGRKITESEVARERAAHRRVNPERYTFPALLADHGLGLEHLIAESLAWISRSVLGRGENPLPIRRLILTAHSGGGAPLNALLRNRATRRVCDPHEAYAFDALYTEIDGLSAWALERLRRHIATPASEAGALRVFFRPHSDTAAQSSALATAIAGSVQRAPAPIARFYRVEATTERHDDIPRFVGPTLLADASAEMPASRRASPPRAQAAEPVPVASANADESNFDENAAERYGIPLGLFRYYSPTSSRTRELVQRARPFASDTMPERSGWSHSGHSGHRSKRS